MSYKTILITGAGGFVGRNLLKYFDKTNKYKIIALVNQNFKINLYTNITFISVKNLNNFNIEKNVQNKIDIIIHLAGKAHSKYSKLSYYNSNFLLTKKIFDYSKRNNIKKFIFFSSIKVNGEISEFNKPFKFDDKPNPQDNYAKSKFECENYLTNQKNHNVKIFILRPPIIIGKNFKGNLSSFIKILDYRIPLPIKNIDNKRSFITIENIYSIIIKIIVSDSSGGVFLISEGYSISTSDLLEKIAFYSKKRIVTFSFNRIILRFFFIFFFLNKIYQKIFLSQEMNIEHTINTFNWHPKDGLELTLKNIFDV